MTTLQKVLLTLAFSLTFLGFVLMFNQKSVRLGSAPSGLQATIASSTSIGLAATTATTLIGTTTCSARTISTKASAIMLTFSDYNGASPTGLFGILQAASTTVTYDSGQFGCGLVKAYAMTADNITVTDVR